MTRETHSEQAPRLLLVEDDADLQRALLRQLRRSGFDVTAGSTLREGVELLRTRRFDAVLTDLALPDGEGTELARLLQDAPASPGVLVMTGHYDEAVSRQARVCGASDCIPKPSRSRTSWRASPSSARASRPRWTSPAALLGCAPWSSTMTGRSCASSPKSSKTRGSS